MTDPGFVKKYADLIRSKELTRQDRLVLAGGTMPNGTPTPPEILGILFHDEDRDVRDSAVGSILKLSEPDLKILATDTNSSSDLLMFLATHFHDYPSIGVAIIGNKNITLDILKVLQGKDDDIESMRLDDADSHEALIEAGYRDAEESYDSSMLNSMIEEDEEMSVEIELGDEPAAFETNAVDQQGSSSVPIDSQKADEGAAFERHDENRPGGGSQQIDGRTDDTGMSHNDILIDDDSGFDDDLIDDDMIDEKDEFSDTVDHIEKKFDDVFDFVPITGGEEEVQALKDELNISRDPVSIPEPPSIDSMRGARRKAEAPKIHDGDAEVTLATEKFVTRIPKQRYYYKAGILELLAPVIKISIPIIVVLLIFAIYFFSVPKEPLSVEQFENGVTRNLVDGKVLGFDSKLATPFPANYALSSWDQVGASDETKVSSGNLQRDMMSFLSTFEVEIEIEEMKKKIEESRSELNETGMRQLEISGEIETLTVEIAELEEIITNENLNTQDIEDKRQAELDAVKEEYSALEEEYLQLEEEIADVKRRIAAYDGPIGADESPGHVANKNDLERLNREYRKIAPEYTKYKNSYQSILDEINKRYDKQDESVDLLKKANDRLRFLEQEQVRNAAMIETSNNQIRSLSKDLTALENSPERGAKLKGASLSKFLVFNYYLVEKLSSHFDEISPLVRYEILKKSADVEITLTSPDGEELTETYVFTFMRMETFNRVLFFTWQYDSTTWVLTGIAGKK
jgi:hypothetical protein